MTLTELLKTIEESNEKLLPYLQAYIRQMLENKDDTYWDENSLEQAKCIFMKYFRDDYDLSLNYLDADLDLIKRENYLSFTEFLSETAPELAAGHTGFIPTELVDDYLDDLWDNEMELDEVMAACLKTVFEEIGEAVYRLPVLFKEDDAARFTAVFTGETYDYVEVKSFLLKKRSTAELLKTMDEKLAAIQDCIVRFVEFAFRNEKEVFWLNDRLKAAKGIVITIEYDSGEISLDLLDSNAQKIEKQDSWDFTRYMKEYDSFTYQRIGVHLPFRIYDVVNLERQNEIDPFKNRINDWLIKGLEGASSSPAGLPCFIREEFTENYLDIKTKEMTDENGLRKFVHSEPF